MRCPLNGQQKSTARQAALQAPDKAKRKRRNWLSDWNETGAFIMPQNLSALFNLAVVKQGLNIDNEILLLSQLA